MEIGSTIVNKRRKGDVGAEGQDWGGILLNLMFRRGMTEMLTFGSKREEWVRKENSGQWE